MKAPVTWATARPMASSTRASAVVNAEPEFRTRARATNHSLSTVLGRRWCTDIDAVTTSVAGGAPVSTDTAIASSARIFTSTVPSGYCSHGLAASLNVALPEPTCVRR